MSLGCPVRVRTKIDGDNSAAVHQLSRCAGWLEAALEYAGGTHAIDDVIREIYTGKLQFWPGERSAIVTEIEYYPLMKSCHFFLAGGDLAELEEMTPKIEAWAKAQGCKRMTLAGRRGWERTFLAGGGYKPHWYVMAKEIL